MKGLVNASQGEAVVKPEVDLRRYRETPREKARIASIFRLIPARGVVALDVGARDGYLTRLLTERFDRVTALDLVKPGFDIDRVDAVAGDVTRLPFEDDQFDVVLCAEVLEHIPPAQLHTACRELARVTRHAVVVGVPFRQDLRADRTSCVACAGLNPPWGHVNSFDEAKLRGLFADLRVTNVDFVGATKTRTNAVSVALMDFAGNPWGTYTQEEPCIHCGGALSPPRDLGLAQRAAAAFALRLTALHRFFLPAVPNWIHLLFEKRQ